MNPPAPRMPERLLSAHTSWRPTSREDGPNASKHYWRIRKRTAVVQTIVGSELNRAGWPPSPARLIGAPSTWTVRFTVYQQRGKLMDSDNLAGCLKAARDRVARYLGCDDGPKGPTWEYRSERGPDGTLIEVLL